MADGINIEGGLDDATLDFADAFKGNSIRDILGRFGNKLQEDLVKSLDSKGKNVTSGLQGSIKFDVTILGSAFVFTLAMADYGKFVDKGVNGLQSAYTTPYSFKSLNPSKQEIFGLTKWVNDKGFGMFGISNQKEAEGMAFGIAKKNRKFGMKPSNFYTSVIEDGRVEALEEELTKEFGNSILGIT